MVAIGLLRSALPDDQYRNPASWPVWRQLLPHVLAVTDIGRDPVSTGSVTVHSRRRHTASSARANAWNHRPLQPYPGYLVPPRFVSGRHQD